MVIFRWQRNFRSEPLLQDGGFDWRRRVPDNWGSCTRSQCRCFAEAHGVILNSESRRGGVLDRRRRCHSAGQGLYVLFEDCSTVLK